MQIHMKWKPITEEEMWDEVNSSWEHMSIPQRNLWEVIRIDPEKWQQHLYGDDSGGFWVVAIFENTIVWYNDIEEGFNRSKYKTYGQFEDYWCNQDELEWTLQPILDEIKDGQPSGGHAGPPYLTWRFTWKCVPPCFTHSCELVVIGKNMI